MSETYHYMTVVQSLVKLAFCHIDMETHHERRLEKGIGKLWGDGKKSS